MRQLLSLVVVCLLFGGELTAQSKAHPKGLLIEAGMTFGHQRLLETEYAIASQLCDLRFQAPIKDHFIISGNAHVGIIGKGSRLARLEGVSGSFAYTTALHERWRLFASSSLGVIMSNLTGDFTKNYMIATGDVTNRFRLKHDLWISVRTGVQYKHEKTEYRYKLEGPSYHDYSWICLIELTGQSFDQLETFFADTKRLLAGEFSIGLIGKYLSMTGRLWIRLTEVRGCYVGAYKQAKHGALSLGIRQYFY